MIEFDMLRIRHNDFGQLEGDLCAVRRREADVERHATQILQQNDLLRPLPTAAIAKVEQFAWGHAQVWITSDVENVGAYDEGECVGGVV